MSETQTEPTPIKSLDELEVGDVFRFESSQQPFIVGGIGDVPEHAYEISFYTLHGPETPEGFGFIAYDRRAMKQSYLRDSPLVKLRREDFKGWKYASTITLD